VRGKRPTEMPSVPFVGPDWPIVSRRAMAVRMTSFARLGPFALVLTFTPALASCWPTGGGTTGSSSGGGKVTTPQTTPPVIDSLDLASPAAINGAFYVITGSITWHDADDVIESGSVYVPVIGKAIPVTIPPEDQISLGAGIPFGFQVSDDIPLGGAGPTTFIVTLTNKSGAVSVGWQATVDLE
jgi:hypothetical protein